MTVLALRPEATLHEVGAALEALGFEITGVDAGEGDLRRVQFADDARETRVVHVEDGYLDVAYVVLTGASAGRVVVALVEARLAFSTDALLEAAEAGLNPADREAMKTLVRLALAAGPEHEAAVYTLFEGIVATGQEAARFTLIAAISCRAVHPEGVGTFRTLLDRLADRDPSDMVREEATVLRAALDGPPSDGAPRDGA